MEQSQDDSQPSEDKNKYLHDKLDQIFNEYYLNQFQKAIVQNFIERKVGDKQNTKTQRVREWLIQKINGTRQKEYSEHQRGCPQIIPGLRAQAWWDTQQFEWVTKIEENYEVIKNELLALRNQKGFQPYRGPSWNSKIQSEDGVGSKSHDKGDWNVFYLYLHDMKFQENCEKVPKTIEIIENLLPRQYKHAFFSAMSPDTHIIKHNGPTNKKLRFHLPLIGVDGSQLRVGDTTLDQQAGKAYLFDDSFEHEAWHKGTETRIILIVDIWHPDLSDEEVKFFSLLQNSKLRYEKKITQEMNIDDNFFSIIDKSKELLKDNNWWVQQE